MLKAYFVLLSETLEMFIIQEVQNTSDFTHFVEYLPKHFMDCS